MPRPHSSLTSFHVNLDTKVYVEIKNTFLFKTLFQCYHFESKLWAYKYKTYKVSNIPMYAEVTIYCICCIKLKKKNFAFEKLI